MHGVNEGRVIAPFGWQRGPAAMLYVSGTCPYRHSTCVSRCPSRGHLAGRTEGEAWLSWFASISSEHLHPSSIEVSRNDTFQTCDV
jgi:hypothetical protein